MMKRHTTSLLSPLVALVMLCSCGAANQTTPVTRAANQTSPATRAAVGSDDAGEKRFALYGIGFYNLENLFDTIHDYAPDGTDKNDYEYLPTGTNRWGTMKYNSKLKNMSTVLSQLATDRIPAGATLIGISEIENRRVVEDLLKQPALADRGYEIAHAESPDIRGVDCAFIYNPKQFRLETVSYPLYLHEDGTVSHTRGFLTVGGTLAGERIHFIVCHWPSRASESARRERAGELVRAVKDSILSLYPGTSVIIMGDLNDDPDDKSIAQSLGAKKNKEECAPSDLYNPWWKTLRNDGVGTLKYDGKWNLFDQIILTGNLVDGDRSHLQYFKNEIFVRDYMVQHEGKYKGYPLRTTSSGAWTNGYSDHFPTTVYLIKEVK